MSFIWPAMLFSLLLIPLLIWRYWRMQERRRQLATHYGTMGFVPASGHSLGRRRHLPPLFFLIALTLLLISLARPEAVVSLPRLEGTIILAFDVSGSMAATDLEPTRIDAAKAAAIDFVQRQPDTIQIGIVTFRDSGFAIQPPTNDQPTILNAINRLQPERSTSLGQGIEAALNTLFAPAEQRSNVYSNLEPTALPTPEPVPPGSNQSAVIVLLSDGENTAPPDPLAVAQSAADRGVRIHTIGIGSPDGATLEVEGFLIHTQLDERTLQEIAELTAGTYFNATSAAELQEIYDKLTPALVIKPEPMEVTALFAGASILVLLIGMTYSLLWFGRAL